MYCWVFFDEKMPLEFQKEKPFDLNFSRDSKDYLENVIKEKGEFKSLKVTCRDDLKNCDFVEGLDFVD